MLFVCVFFAGCAKYGDVYDNDDLIISKKSYHSRSGSRHSINSERYTDTTKMFNGVDTIKTNTLHATSTPLSTYSLQIDLKINSGDFKLVLTNNTEIFLITDTGYDAIYTIDLPDGTYSLKMVGRDADFALTINFGFYE